MAVWKCQNCQQSMRLPNDSLHNTQPPASDLRLRADTPEGVLRLTCEEVQLLPVQIG